MAAEGTASDVALAAVVSAAKREWERTVDALTDGLMIVDGGFKIRRANLPLAEAMGLPIGKLVGRPCHEVRGTSRQAFVRQDDGVCEGCPVAAARAARAPCEAELRTPEGRAVVVHAFPVLDEDGLIVCHYREVTAERALAAQLLAAEKLAAVGRLASGVAHEINNPLGSILAFTQLLMREPPAGERDEFLREIEANARRAKAIVESLTRYARPTVSGAARLDLNRAVREAAQGWSARSGGRPTLTLTLTLGEPPVILGHEAQIRQLVFNLIVNAADAAGPTGRVEVRSAGHGEQAELRVIDDGPSFDERAREHAFEPFPPSSAGGAAEHGRRGGVGLAVCGAIVGEHGGAIEVHNHAGGGAEVCVRLPAAP